MTKLGILLVTILVILFSGCDSENSQKFDELTKEVQSGVSKTIKDLGDYSQNSEIGKLSQEQVENLFRIEYKILEFTDSASQQQIEGVMQMAGNDRWDCFSVEKAFDKTRIYCKRRPTSVLRYFPMLSFLLN